MDVLAFVAVILFALHVQTLVLPDFEQIALRLFEGDADEAPQEDRSCSNSIAIIGSGISGAIAAFKLYEGYRRKALPNQQPCITVFERNPIVGGRITEAFMYNDPSRPVDTVCHKVFEQD